MNPSSTPDTTMPAAGEVPAEATPAPTTVAQAVAAVAPTVQAVAQTTQAAAQTVTTATKQAQATVQQTAQHVTVSPRKAIYRGRQFAIGYALLVMVLGFMAGMARRYKVLPGDVGITRFIQHPSNAPYDTLMKLVSEMGWQWPSVITRLTATGLIWSAGFRLEGAFVAATWSGDIVTVLIKETVGRPRPTRDLVKVSYTLGEHSFPSGHVVHYVTFYGFLFYIFLVHLKEGKGRNAMLTLLALIVLLIGPSRVYQGAHWPSDVTAAYLVGSLWLAVQIIAYVEFKSRFQIHTHWPFLVSRSRKV